MPTGLSIFRPRITQQPGSRLRINSANPLTKGLVFSAYNAASDYMAPPVNYVTGIAGTGIKDVSVSVNGGIGAAPLFNGSTSGAVAPLDLSPFTLVTFTFWLYWNAFASDGDIALSYGFPAGSTWPSAFIVQPNESTGGFGIWNWNTNGSTFDRDTIVRPSAAVWHHYAICINRTVSGFALQKITVDGIPTAVNGTGTHNFLPNAFLANGNLGFMGRTGIGLTEAGAGRIANVNIWSRFLSYADINSIMTNPSQILDPGLLRVGIAGPVTGGGAARRWFLAA